MTQRKTETHEEFLARNRQANCERNRKYRATNDENIKQRKKKWRLKNRERIIARERAWRSKNADRINEWQRKWRAENKDYINQQSREKRARNPEQFRKYSRTYIRTPKGHYKSILYSAKTRGIRVELSYEEYTAIIAANSCHYCGGPLPEAGSGLDRKNSSIGYNAANCIACCDPCNTMKSNKLSYEEMKLIWAIRRGEVTEQILSDMFLVNPEQGELRLKVAS